MPYIDLMSPYVDPITGQVRKRRNNPLEEEEEGFLPADGVSAEGTPVPAEEEEEEGTITPPRISDIAPTVSERPEAQPEAVRPTAIGEYISALKAPPQEPKPKWYNRLGAAAVGAAGGYLQATGKRGLQVDQKVIDSGAEAALRPGYAGKMRSWQERVSQLKDAALAESMQTKDEREAEQHKAVIARSAADTEAAKARGDYYRRRPSTPPPTVPRTYEAHLVDLLKSGNPEQQADAQKKLDELNKKNSPSRSLLVKEFITKGLKTLRFYDPSTGNLVKEESAKHDRPLAPPSPTTQLTVDYRKKQEQARDWAGRAQQLNPNDRVAARDWLAAQVSDPEVLNMALGLIRDVPQRDDDDLSRAREILGLTSPPSQKTGTPSSRLPRPSQIPGSTGRNPYR